MATWHQMKNQAPLWSEDKWTVVSDPPNKCRGLTRFDSSAAAEEYMDNLKKLGKGEHCYILSPRQG